MPCSSLDDAAQASTKISLVPAEVFAQSLTHGLEHDAVDLGDGMRAVEDDLAARGSVIECDG